MACAARGLAPGAMLAAALPEVAEFGKAAVTIDGEDYNARWRSLGPDESSRGRVLLLEEHRK